MAMMMMLMMMMMMMMMMAAGKEWSMCLHLNRNVFGSVLGVSATALILLSCSCLVTAHPHQHDVEVNLDHESDVYLHVLDEHHYVRHLRPAASSNDSVVVDLDLTLVALHGLDLPSGTLEMTLRLFMKWEDPRLHWNSTGHGGLKEIPVPSSKIWTPDFSLFSNSLGSHTIVSGKHAILHHDGVVTWLCDVRLHSGCRVDLSKFPFDSHSCLLELTHGSELDEPIHVHVFQSPPGSVMDLTKGHVDTNMAGEWELLANEIRVSDSSHGVEVRVEAGRRAELYQCALVAPVVLVALLTPSIFLLPTDSAAKITLGGLLQISLCICLRSLYDMVHGAHGSVPNIALFGVASLALTSISIVMSAFVMSLASRRYTTRPVPDWVSAMILGRCGVRRWVCMDTYPPGQRHTPFASRRSGKDAHTEADADVTSLKGSDSPGDVKMTLSGGGRHCRAECDEWMEVARVLDRAFFVLFIVLFMLLCVSLLS